LAVLEPGVIDGDGGDPFTSDSRPRRARSSLGSRLRQRLVTATERRGWRLDPGVRGAAAMGIAALVAVLIAGWWVVSARPNAAAIITPTSASTRSTGVSVATHPASARLAASASPGAELVIDVVGRVLAPGIYRLPAGSRVDDAIRAAGGVLPGTDVTSLNLARKLSDGEQIAVGVVGAPPAADGTGAATSGPVDLNTATLAQLDALPGVGPVLAQHILDWRTAHGKFDSVDQLREVSGIGEAKYADLRPLVTV
jgi:competence protein ComEA